VEQRFAFYAAKIDSRRPIHDFFGSQEAAQEQQGQEKVACGNVGQGCLAKTRLKWETQRQEFSSFEFQVSFFILSN